MSFNVMFSKTVILFMAQNVNIEKMKYIHILLTHLIQKVWIKKKENYTSIYYLPSPIPYLHSFVNPKYQVFGS